MRAGLKELTALDDDRASRATVPLLVNTATPEPRPGMTASFAGIGTVGAAVVVNPR